jgi:4-carboxymuconolactone decarboxylase
VSEPRIPFSPQGLREDVDELLPLIAPPGREPARTMAVLGRAPDLLAPFLGWAAALALQGTLPKRDHELLALRAAWNCRSDFEWGEHAEYARAAGLTDADVLAVAGDPAAFTPTEAALLRAADELHAGSDIRDATWSTLAAHYDDAQLVEILFVVGQYTMLSMVANAARVGLPDGLDPLPPGDRR